MSGRSPRTTAASRTYTITGQVFFASAERFVDSFDYKEVIEQVRIDVSRAHFWDITAVSALDKVVIKFRREGTGRRGHRAERGQRHHGRQVRRA